MGRDGVQAYQISHELSMASLSHDRRPAIKFVLLHQCPARRGTVQYVTFEFTTVSSSSSEILAHSSIAWLFHRSFSYLKRKPGKFPRAPLQLAWNTCSDELGISSKRSRWLVRALEWVDSGVLTTFRILFDGNPCLVDVYYASLSLGNLACLFLSRDL